jgi:hypothetical protein
MFCSQCGTELAVDSNFCPKCGKPITSQSKIISPMRNGSTLAKSAPLESVSQPPNSASTTKSPTRRLLGFLFRGRPGFELMVLFVIYAILLAVNIPYSLGESNHNEYKGQQIMIMWFISGLVFRNYWKGRNRKGWIGALVGVLVATVVIIFGEAMHIRSQQKYEAAQVVSEIQKDVSDLKKSAADDQGVPKPTGQLDTTPKMKGDLGEEERFAKTFINKMVSQRNDYLHELDAIGWGKLLDAERIRKDKNLVESKMIIQKAKDIVSQYRADTNILFDNARKEIGTLNVSEDSRQKIMSGFNRGMAKNRSRIDSVWDLEAKSVAKFGNIFALLSTKMGAWEVQDGKILFANDSDLKEFNSYLTNIKELTNEEDAIQQQSSEAVNNTFKAEETSTRGFVPLEDKSQPTKGGSIK